MATQLDQLKTRGPLVCSLNTFYKPIKQRFGKHHKKATWHQAFFSLSVRIVSNLKAFMNCVSQESLNHGVVSLKSSVNVNVTISICGLFIWNTHVSI